MVKDTTKTQYNSLSMLGYVYAKIEKYGPISSRAYCNYFGNVVGIIVMFGQLFPLRINRRVHIYLRKNSIGT